MARREVPASSGDAGGVAGLRPASDLPRGYGDGWHRLISVKSIPGIQNGPMHFACQLFSILLKISPKLVSNEAEAMLESSKTGKTGWRVSG